jgi:hypothetical protein
MSLHNRDNILSDLRERYTKSKTETYLKIELSKPKGVLKNHQSDAKSTEK